MCSTEFWVDAPQIYFYCILGQAEICSVILGFGWECIMHSSLKRHFNYAFLSSQCSYYFPFSLFDFLDSFIIHLIRFCFARIKYGFHSGTLII